jgi:predicted dehydrogenase
MARIGILGAGFMGAAHSAAINNIERHTLVAIADIDRKKGEKLCRERNCLYIPTAEELIARDDIDIVHICLPTNCHEKYIIMAAQAEKNILCEKPFALHADEIDRAVEAVRKSGVKFMIAQVVRFWPENVAIKEYVESGALGEIKQCYAHRLAQPPAWATWYGEKDISGGGLFDLHTHDVDNMIDVFGKCTEVYAVGNKFSDGCWNYITTSLTFASGKKSVVESCLNMPGDYPFSTSFRITGTKISLEQVMKAGANLDDMSNSIRYLKKYETGKECEDIPYGNYDAYQKEIEHFANCVDTNTDPRIPIEESRNVMKVMRAIEKSLETGQIVPTGW